jgi:hypothetical protein
MAEAVPEVSGEGIKIHVFDGHVQDMVTVLATATLSLAHMAPVRGAIAGPAEPFAIDEGFHQVHRMAVSGLPISSEPSGYAAQ